MDIEEFIELDILAFLDTEAQEPQSAPRPKGTDEESGFITRDYEKEFFAALDDGSLTKAKRVLHDLKQRFDESPAGTSEREQLKALLTDLYEKFKDHLDAQRSYERVESTLSRMDAQQARGPTAAPRDAALPQPTAAPRPAPAGRPDAPSATPAAQPAAAPLKPSAPPAPVSAGPPAATPPAAQGKEDARKARARTLAAHAHALLDDVERALAQGDAAQAARAYRLARKDALGMEREVPEDLALRFSALFTRIRDAMAPPQRGAEAGAKGASPSSAARAQARTQRALDKDLLLQLEREKHALDAQLRGDDLASAMRTYRGMRLLAQEISDAEAAEDAARKLVRIYAIIAHIRGHADQDDRGLAPAVP